MNFEVIQAYIPNVVLLMLLVLVLFIAHRNKDTRFNAYDFFIDPVTQKASITRTMQVMAGVTATWIVIRLAAHNQLTVDLFAVYLGALGISEAWSKFIGAKYVAPPTPPDNKDQPLNG